MVDVIATPQIDAPGPAPNAPSISLPSLLANDTVISAWVGYTNVAALDSGYSNAFGSTAVSNKYHFGQYIADSGASGTKTLTMNGASAPAVSQVFIAVAFKTNVSCTPDHLTFTAQPSNAAQGASLGTVSVAVKDSGGTTCTSDTSSVTLSEHTGATWGTLFSGSSLTKSAVAGVATWTDLHIDSAGSGSIDAADSGLTGATSNSITISASCGSGSGAGIVIVQCKQGITPITAGSGTIVFASTPTANNFWIAVVGSIGFSAASQKITTCADSQSNSVTVHLNESFGASPTPGASLCSAKIVSTGSSFTVTFTSSDSNDLYGQYILMEVSGLDPTTWFDGITSTGTGQSSGGGTVTVTRGGASTTNNALVIAVMSTNNTLTSSATSGYTDLEADTYQSLAYKFITSGGTPAAAWTMSAGDYDGFVAVFRGIDSTPGARPHTLTLLGVGD